MYEKVDFEKQTAFVTMLRDDYVLSGGEIKSMFDVEDPEKFIEGVIKRTGLEIEVGKRIFTSKSQNGTSFDVPVYYLGEKIHLEVAGLEDMQITVDPDTVTQDEVEYLDGHYIMWVCPNLIPDKISGEDGTYCGKFHKVDLGDELLTQRRVVRCMQCGTEYQIKPRGIV
jgi:hypothetical protein